MLSPLATAVTLGGSELFGVAGSGQRLGPGGSGPRAQSPAGPHLAQTRRSGTAQSPAVRLNGLLVLSRKLSPARLREVGREGGELSWPRALAGLASSSLLPSLSQTLTLPWPFIPDHLFPRIFTASRPWAGPPNNLELQSFTSLWCPLSSIHLGSYLPASVYRASSPSFDVQQF